MVDMVDIVDNILVYENLSTEIVDNIVDNLKKYKYKKTK